MLPRILPLFPVQLQREVPGTVHTRSQKSWQVVIDNKQCGCIEAPETQFPAPSARTNDTTLYIREQLLT